MKVYIVAGEPSGDLLASSLMRVIRQLAPDVKFRGVGGESMMSVGIDDVGHITSSVDLSAGAFSGVDPDRDESADGDVLDSFRSLFDISEISVMGIFEVLPRLPLIFKRINHIIKDIEDFTPDVLVTVDSWGFVSTLLTRLRKKWRREARRGEGMTTQMPVVHYVAPQVWAWKKGRAKNVARLVDRLMTLLPDEGLWFDKYGLHSDFVGHPVIERVAQAEIDLNGFRAVTGIPADATVVSVLPGSRYSEIKRLMPILKKAVERLAATTAATTTSSISATVSVAATSTTVISATDEAEILSPSTVTLAGGARLPDEIFVIVPTVAGVEDEVRRGFEGFPLPVQVVTGEQNRYNAFAVSSLALAKSGTVSLELVSLGVPHLIAYTFGRMSNFMAKLLVKVRFANLVNILADREIIPEFVLSKCRPELIANCAIQLLNSSELADKQVTEAREVMKRLRLPDQVPSVRAAQIVIEMANNKK